MFDFRVYFTENALRRLSLPFIIGQIRKLFETEVRRFQEMGFPDEFFRFGGPRGAVVHNLKLALKFCGDDKVREEIRQGLKEAIPEIATP